MMARKNLADLDTLPSPSPVSKATLVPNSEEMGAAAIRITSATYGK
jgi:hypothetical protein